MGHADHVGLIEKGIKKNSGGIWADFGSGEGAFTLALRDVVGPEVEIYSIDRDERSLGIQKEKFSEMFPDSNIHFIPADFTEVLDFPPLDGLIAANSIHFHKDTVRVVKQLSKYLKPGGTFIVVEYNVDHGNTWVPYPFSFESFQHVAVEAGLKDIQLLATHPSNFLQEMYAAKASL